MRRIGRVGRRRATVVACPRIDERLSRRITNTDPGERTVETSPLTSIVEQLGRHASVETVYGDPIEFGDRTVVPVAKIGYGFGGGYGSDDEDEGASGAGGGLSAKPLGAVELTNDGARFVRFESRKRLLLALVAGFVLGTLWRRRR